MISHNKINIVKEAFVTLINCGDDCLEMKQATDNLYEIFHLITGIDIAHLNEGDIFLPSGKAISPSAAAHCLLEMKRTAIFLRGIKKAIDKKIKNNLSTIKVLYAGCGPYATLVAPLLTAYHTNNIKVTLLDINHASLNAAEKLIASLGLEKFIDGYILADASVYRMDKDYDIVISETMQSCLHNEPQVTVMQNLIPQMKGDAVFIPQRITIDAYLRTTGKWGDKEGQYNGATTKFLRKLFSVDHENLDGDKYRNTVDIPQNINDYAELMLYTTVEVFEDEVLRMNDCSLNLPKKFYRYMDRYAKAVEFWYAFSAQPRIEHRVIDLF